MPVANFVRDGATFRLIAPHPTNALYDFDERNSQLAAIADYVDSAEMPLIISGDLNVTMWSGWYKAIERAGMQNTRQGFGILPTWQTPLPLITLPIDHILTSTHFATHSIKTIDGLPSDHRPLVVELGLR